MHFNEVLDMGIDYGATGGPAWATTVVQYPNGRTRRNIDRSIALGGWQLGNRNVDIETHDKLRDFFHAMRGRAHSFLYLDWNDYEAKNELLTIDGSDEAQLTKVYGISINPWTRDIIKPNVETVVIEQLDNEEWVELVRDTDYEVDPDTGIVTWLNTDTPSTGAPIRWSGKFWVPARFDTDIFDAQFLGLEELEDGSVERAYHLGSLAVVEEPDPEPAE